VVNKRCGNCGREYTAKEWKELFPLGDMVDADPSFPVLELRRCVDCKSTMAVEVDPWWKHQEDAAQRLMKEELVASQG
jgi:hypothetical protein